MKRKRTAHRKQKPATVARRHAQRSTNKKRDAMRLPAEAYDLLPRAQVTLTAETCWLTRFDERGKPNTTYPVRAQDVARAFDIFNASTGILPPDVLFWAQAASHARLGIWLPPARRALRFETKRVEKLNVPLPGLLFVGQGNQYFIFAAAERPKNLLTALFHAPLPNVNNNGLICAGTVKFPACASDTIHDAANLFFESAFNLDLSVGKFSDAEDDEEDEGTWYDQNEYPTARRRHKRTLLHFLRDLQSLDAFPLAQLVPSQVTLQQLAEGN